MFSCNCIESVSPTMEKISATNPKYISAIAHDSWTCTQELLKRSFLYAPYKLFPSIKKFSNSPTFIFHCTHFCGLSGACVKPVSFSSNSLFVHSLVCLIHTYLTFLRISAKLVPALLPNKLCLSYVLLKMHLKKLQVDSYHNLDLQHMIFSYTIYFDVSLYLWV